VRKGKIQRQGSSSSSAEYHAWQRIKDRCGKPSHHKYKLYGGRGIKVCDRWLVSFLNFWADMGPRPSLKHSIERIDNDGDYSPENCRWATRKEQARNTRRNRWVTFRGERVLLIDLAPRLGIKLPTLYWRLQHGWNQEEACTFPLRPGYRPPSVSVDGDSILIYKREATR